VDLAASKKTCEVDVDPLLTAHPATKVEETVTVEEEATVDDLTVTMIVEVEEEDTRETNDTLQAEEENDLTVLLRTEIDTVREEAIATVRAVVIETITVLRGTTVIVITDASPGGGIRGHLTLQEQGRGLPSGGKGPLLVTKSRKITRYLKSSHSLEKQKKTNGISKHSPSIILKFKSSTSVLSLSLSTSQVVSKIKLVQSFLVFVLQWSQIRERLNQVS